MEISEARKRELQMIAGGMKAAEAKKPTYRKGAWKKPLYFYTSKALQKGLVR